MKTTLCSMSTAQKMPLQVTPAAQSGFSMIEVLVSIVLLAFGLLGILGLQLEAIRGNQGAAQISTATSLAKDFQEILTSLPSVTATTSVNAITAVAQNTYAGYSATEKDCKGNSVTCSNTEQADFQVREWIDRVQKTLPVGKVTVCFDSAFVENSGSGSGLYKWTCNNSGDIMVLKIGWALRLSKNSSGQIIESGIDDGTDRPRLVVPITGNQEGFRL